jgi:predicted nucleic acid-binding protein
MRANELSEGEKVFVDANIFLFNALDDLRYGESSTQFLEKIERGEIKALTNVLVLNEVAFKILMAELSNYSEKINIWIAKKLLKSKEIAEKVYKPVKKYLAYLDMKELGMKFIVTDDADFKRVDWAAVVELEVAS